MEVSKSDNLYFDNSMSDSDFSKPNSLVNAYEDRFFKEMDIAEKSVVEEGTVSSEELRKTLGI